MHTHTITPSHTHVHKHTLRILTHTNCQDHLSSEPHPRKFSKVRREENKQVSPVAIWVQFQAINTSFLKLWGHLKGVWIYSPTAGCKMKFSLTWDIIKAHSYISKSKGFWRGACFILFLKYRETDSQDQTGKNSCNL